MIAMLPAFAEVSAAETLSANDITAEAAVLIDSETGDILFEKDSSKKLGMASTTKIMTGILALENCRLDDIVTISRHASYTEGSSIYTKEGEKISVETLIYGLLLKSGNDAAAALAEHMAGSEEAFADMMNEKAKKLGLKNTHFVNPHGLYDPDHYTTAYDMMLITKAAVQNKKLMSVAPEVKYTLHKNSVRAEDLEMSTGHRMMDKDTAQYYQGVIFGKTGYTNAARATLVTVAKKDDRNLIVVTLGHENRFKQYNDTKILLDYGFGSFYRFVISKDDLKGMVKLKKSEYADIQNDFVIVLPTDVKRENLTQSVDVVNGEIFITLTGGENDVTQKIGTVAEKSGSFGAAVLRGLKLIFTILLYLVVIFIVLFIILLIYINRRNKKRIAEKKRKERINSNYKYYNM